MIIIPKQKISGLRLAWALIGLVAISMSACGYFTSPMAQESIVEPALSDQNVLRIYNWDTYIDPQILSDFEQEFGVKIDYQVFDTDADMLEELRQGSAEYDLVVSSDYVLHQMRVEGLLAPLNKANIPNFKNVAADFINPSYDPANRYCAPYQWGTLGIGYNIQATGKEIKTWADFFDPQYAGLVTMFDDPRYTLGIILIYLGYSPNTTNPAEIAMAVDYLKQMDHHVAGFTGDDGQDGLASDDMAMVMEFSGDIFQLMSEDEDIRYVIPEDGSIIWTDNICVPATGKNKELAEKFIDFLLRPEVGAALSTYTQYASPNQASMPLINPQDLNNHAIYPSVDVRERLFFVVDVGNASSLVYEENWAQVVQTDGK